MWWQRLKSSIIFVYNFICDSPSPCPVTTLCTRVSHPPSPPRDHTGSGVGEDGDCPIHQNQTVAVNQAVSFLFAPRPLFPGLSLYSSVYVLWLVCARNDRIRNQRQISSSVFRFKNRTFFLFTIWMAFIFPSNFIRRPIVCMNFSFSKMHNR